MWHQFFILTAFTTVGLLLMIFASWYIQTRKLARPITQLTDNVETAIENESFTSDAIDIAEIDQLRNNFERLIGQLLEGKIAVESRSEELAKANGLLEQSLSEKVVLLKEIHHRVKNNLQIFSSMLYLQGKEIKDERDRELFADSQNRVRSMALIHERLYQSEDLNQVDFSQYVPSLVETLFSTYRNEDQHVSLCIEVEDLMLDLDRAIPCGLMINELVANSLKYAFPTGQAGEISIHLRLKDNELVELVAADDGIGQPVEFDIKNSNTLGLQLIHILTRQLSGSLSVRKGEGGAQFTIIFPLEIEDATRDLA